MSAFLVSREVLESVRKTATERSQRDLKGPSRSESYPLALWHPQPPAVDGPRGPALAPGDAPAPSLAELACLNAVAFFSRYKSHEDIGQQIGEWLGAVLTEEPLDLPEWTPARAISPEQAQNDLVCFIYQCSEGDNGFHDKEGAKPYGHPLFVRLAKLRYEWRGIEESEAYEKAEWGR